MIKKQTERDSKKPTGNSLHRVASEPAISSTAYRAENAQTPSQLLLSRPSYAEKELSDNAINTQQPPSTKIAGDRKKSPHGVDEFRYTPSPAAQNQSRVNSPCNPDRFGASPPPGSQPLQWQRQYHQSHFAPHSPEPGKKQQLSGTASGFKRPLNKETVVNSPKPYHTHSSLTTPLRSQPITQKNAATPSAYSSPANGWLPIAISALSLAGCIAIGYNQQKSSSIIIPASLYSNTVLYIALSACLGPHQQAQNNVTNASIALCSFTVSSITSMMVMNTGTTGEMTASLIAAGFIANHILYLNDIGKVGTSFQHFFQHFSAKSNKKKVTAIAKTLVSLGLSIYPTWDLLASMYQRYLKLCDAPFLSPIAAGLISPWTTVPIMLTCGLANLCFAKRGIDKTMKVTAHYVLSLCKQANPAATTTTGPSTETALLAHHDTADLSANTPTDTETRSFLQNALLITAAAAIIWNGVGNGLIAGAKEGGDFNWNALILNTLSSTGINGNAFIEMYFNTSAKKTEKQTNQQLHDIESVRPQSRRKEEDIAPRTRCNAIVQAAFQTDVNMQTASHPELKITGIGMYNTLILASMSVVAYYSQSGLIDNTFDAEKDFLFSAFFYHLSSKLLAKIGRIALTIPKLLTVWNNLVAGANQCCTTTEKPAPLDQDEATLSKPTF